MHFSIKPWVAAAALAVGLLGMAAAPAAAQTVDQSQLDDSLNLVDFTTSKVNVQSFKQTADNIVGARFRTGVKILGRKGDITIKLFDGLPSSGGSELASGTASGVVSGQWAEVLWSKVGITPEQTYFLAVSSSEEDMMLLGSGDNPYSRGQLWVFNGAAGFPDYDFAFETLADAPVSAVPEPVSLALMLPGLGAVVLLKRRKQRA